MIHEVQDQKITIENRKNYVGHTIKEEGAFWEIECITDNEIQPLVFGFLDSDDVDDSAMNYLDNGETVAKYKSKSLLPPMMQWHRNKKEHRLLRVIILCFVFYLVFFIQRFALSSRLMLLE